jgi:hypothetical protein
MSDTKEQLLTEVAPTTKTPAEKFDEFLQEHPERPEALEYDV